MKAELLRRAVNLLRELKNYCAQTLRFILIGSVYWCASERMHAAHLVFAAAEVVTESRTKEKCL